MEKTSFLIGMTLCLSLTLSACGAEPSAAESATPNTFGTAVSTEELVTPETVEEPVEDIEMDSTAPDSAFYETTEVADTAPETVEYPSTEEILADINAGTYTLYWLADAPDISGTIDIQTVEQPDMDSFWAKLSPLVGDSYSTGGDKLKTSLQLIPNDSSGQIDDLLAAVEQVTGLSYVQVETPDGYVSGYVPQLNGVNLDAVGYPTYIDGGYFSGTYIGVTDNGQITIVNPLILTDETETVNISDLVTAETVETVCRAYYEANEVTVFTDMTLEYYYADGKLQPAWVCDFTFYRDENGLQDSAMVDAQTGELIRK
jgi:hypothetical protein